MSEGEGAGELFYRAVGEVGKEVRRGGAAGRLLLGSGRGSGSVCRKGRGVRGASVVLLDGWKHWQQHWIWAGRAGLEGGWRTCRSSWDEGVGPPLARTRGERL